MLVQQSAWLHDGTSEFSHLDGDCVSLRNISVLKARLCCFDFYCRLRPNIHEPPPCPPLPQTHVTSVPSDTAAAAHRKKVRFYQEAASLSTNRTEAAAGLQESFQRLNLV